ncbi:hypothetical protein [Nocardioides zhouii]|uniref:Lipopolysaccharide biosynthesis protein n=1 Tax=Nocardioides zhouii TaxID=1168729 RepID=A0A4Q2SZ72_9ACTN|nr:hypothetical protein [Nocardioides zhouii]RYC11535.1 hypothetical protein EUA94_09240 [Nocardioides zhouii]
MTAFRRLGLGVIDQALSSLSNVLFLVAVARVSGVEEFGAVSFGYALFAFGLSVQRSSIGLLVSLSARRNLPPPALLALLWALVVVALGLALGATVGDGGSAAYYVVVAGCLVVYPQDILRYNAIAQRRAGHAVLSDAIWTSATVALVLASLAGVSMDTTTMVLVWVGAGCVALVAIALAEQVAVASSPRRWFADHADELRILGPDAVLASLAPLLLAATMAEFMTLGDVAAVRGAGTLLGPTAVLFAALPAVILPEMARILGDDRARLARVQAFVMGLLVVAWGGFLLLVPDDVGVHVLGETWTRSIAVLPYAVLELVMWALAAGPISLLSAYRRWRTLLLARVAYMAMVTCALAVTIASDSVVRVMIGMAVASAGNCLVLAIAARGLSRDHVAVGGAPDSSST